MLDTKGFEARAREEVKKLDEGDRAYTLAFVQKAYSNMTPVEDAGFVICNATGNYYHVSFMGQKNPDVSMWSALMNRYSRRRDILFASNPADETTTIRFFFTKASCKREFESVYHNVHKFKLTRRVDGITTDNDTAAKVHKIWEILLNYKPEAPKIKAKAAETRSASSLGVDFYPMPDFSMDIVDYLLEQVRGIGIVIRYTTLHDEATDTKYRVPSLGIMFPQRKRPAPAPTADYNMQSDDEDSVLPSARTSKRPRVDFVDD